MPFHDMTAPGERGRGEFPAGKHRIPPRMTFPPPVAFALLADWAAPRPSVHVSQIEPDSPTPPLSQQQQLEHTDRMMLGFVSCADRVGGRRRRCASTCTYSIQQYHIGDAAARAPDFLASSPSFLSNILFSPFTSSRFSPVPPPWPASGVYVRRSMSLTYAGRGVFHIWTWLATGMGMVGGQSRG